MAKKKDIAKEDREKDERILRGHIQGALTGDERAFEDLVHHCHGRIYPVVYRIVRSEADAVEVEQLTWIKVWKKLNTFRGEASFYSWLYRIATFTALDFLRKSRRRGEVGFIDEMETPGLPGEMDGGSHHDRPDQALRRREIRERFERALERLPEKQRIALILREVEGMSYKEIAESMKCRTGTVMSRLFHGRQAIQAYLGDV